MKIGVCPVLSGKGGGIYQYSLRVLYALEKWKNQGGEDEFVLFTDELHHPVLNSLRKSGWDVKRYHSPSLKRFLLRLLRRVAGEKYFAGIIKWLKRWQPDKQSFFDPDVIRFRADINAWFHACGVELMLFCAPNTLSFETYLPSVMPIHDLLFRVQEEFQESFPEVTADGAWESREYICRNATRYATLLLADSQVGKDYILKYYGSYVTSDRIKILPFVPTPYLNKNVSESEQKRIRETYHLPKNYLFYPAQFWPHKNHLRLIDALSLLKEKYRLKIPVVFCGSCTGGVRKKHYQDVMSSVHQYGLGDEIFYLGYVPDEVMSGLYASATALVSPTFNGPTTLPILEAWAFGCPVLNSDIPGIREQVGDAALLVDPKSVEAIAEGIYKLWTDENLRHILAKRGRLRLSGYSSDDFQHRLIEILAEAKNRVLSEKPRNYDKGLYREI